METENPISCKMNIIMNMLYNSDHFYVVEYPAQQGFELVDKQTGRGGFILGEVAARFKDSMSEAVANGLTVEEVDELLESFGALLTQPIVYH